MGVDCTLVTYNVLQNVVAEWHRLVPSLPRLTERTKIDPVICSYFAGAW